jgi:hypothetical protein
MDRSISLVFLAAGREAAVNIIADAKMAAIAIPG